MASEGRARANAWKQSGRISLWRYAENERNYPGWNLNADADGCQSLLELLDALAVDGAGTRTITLSPPTAAQLRVPNNRRGTAALLAPEKWRLALSRQSTEWDFPRELQPAVLAFGSNWLTPLKTGVAGIQAGIGDYSIGDPRGVALWFWW